MVENKLERLKQLLGITDNTKDFVLQYELDTVTDMVLNYCNITEIPEKLENIILSMCVDKYRAESLGSETAQGHSKEYIRRRCQRFLWLCLFRIR